MKKRDGVREARSNKTTSKFWKADGPNYLTLGLSIIGPTLSELFVLYSPSTHIPYFAYDTSEDKEMPYGNEIHHLPRVMTVGGTTSVTECRIAVPDDANPCPKIIANERDPGKGS